MRQFFGAPPSLLHGIGDTFAVRIAHREPRTDKAFQQVAAALELDLNRS